MTPTPWCLPKPVAQQRVRSEFKLSKEPQVASPPFEPEHSHIFLHSCCLEGTRVIFLCIWICVCESIITHHWLIFRLSQAFIANPWNKQVYLYLPFFFLDFRLICLSSAYSWSCWSYGNLILTSRGAGGKESEKNKETEKLVLPLPFPSMPWHSHSSRGQWGWHRTETVFKLRCN